MITITITIDGGEFSTHVIDPVGIVERDADRKRQGASRIMRAARFNEDVQGALAGVESDVIRLIADRGAAGHARGVNL